jgi:hypothetical protein
MLIRTKPLHLEYKPTKKYYRCIPVIFIGYFRMLLLIREFIKCKKIDENKNEFIVTPYDGHILIKTSNGYKVFNLHKKIVITQYLSDINEEKFNLFIRRLESIQMLDVSPQIKLIDHKNKSVTEQYYNYKKAKRFYPINSYFINRIIPVWEKIIKKCEIKEHNLCDYVRKHVEGIENRISILEQNGYDKSLFERIEKYLEKLTTNLGKENNERIYLAFTHGDLHAWNILLNFKRAIIIDWDTLKERSIYHDFFYMFYHNMFGKQDCDFTKGIFEFVQCLHSVNKLMERQIQATFDLDLYRSLFFLEYLYMDFELRIDMTNNKDKKEILINNLNECVRVFEEVEINFIN